MTASNDLDEVEDNQSMQDDSIDLTDKEQNALDMPNGLENLDRMELIHLGSKFRIAHVANLSSPEIRSKIRSLAGSPDTTRDEKMNVISAAVARRAAALNAPEIVAAKEAYEEAKQRIKDCILANQMAMVKAKADPTPENRAAYEATRKAHKDSILHIKGDGKTKGVRAIYKDLVNKALASLD